MKREAFNHPKVKLIARDLKLAMFAARGLVDSLWTITAMNFPQGQIRWTPEELAMSLDYAEDADVLVDALIKRKLLDVMADSSWYVHDWHEHADDAVHMKLGRHGLRFANGAIPSLGRLSKEQREKMLQKYEPSEPVVRTDAEVVRTEAHKSALPEPEPEPEPEPVINKQEEVGRCASAPPPVSTAKPKFVPPTKEEAAAFFRERGQPGEMARKFWFHFDSNGWKVSGRAPMKSWESAAEKWILEEKDRSNNRGRASPQRGESISEALAKNPWRDRPQEPEVKAIGD